MIRGHIVDKPISDHESWSVEELRKVFVAFNELIIDIFEKQRLATTTKKSNRIRNLPMILVLLFAKQVSNLATRTTQINRSLCCPRQRCWGRRFTFMNHSILLEISPNPNT